MTRSILRSLFPLGLLPLVYGARAADLPVSFNRDIRPIMSDTCFHCHGFDSKSREAGMRLDVREEGTTTGSGRVLLVIYGESALPPGSAVRLIARLGFLAYHGAWK